MNTSHLLDRSSRAQQFTAHARNRIRDLGLTGAGEDRAEGVLRRVDEQGARDARAEHNTQHLADGHKAHAVRDFSGLDFHLRHSKARLAETAHARAEDDGVPVDFGIACVLVDKVCFCQWLLVGGGEDGTYTSRRRR